MSSFDEIGEAMILAHAGQHQLARALVAGIARFAARAVKFVTRSASKVPPAAA
jgi:hypothetical protein